MPCFSTFAFGNDPFFSNDATSSSILLSYSRVCDINSTALKLTSTWWSTTFVAWLCDIDSGRASIRQGTINQGQGTFQVPTNNLSGRLGLGQLGRRNSGDVTTNRTEERHETKRIHELPYDYTEEAGNFLDRTTYISGPLWKL